MDAAVGSWRSRDAVRPVIGRAALRAAASKDERQIAPKCGEMIGCHGDEPRRRESPRTGDISGLVATLVVAGIALSAGPASATTFADTTVEELVAASELVVVGDVVSTRVFEHGPGGQSGIHTQVRLRVSEVLRGAGRTEVTIWVPGGRIGRRLRRVSGQATFRSGEQVLVLVHWADGGWWPTGMGRGKWLPSASARGFYQPVEPLVHGAGTESVPMAAFRALCESLEGPLR